MTTNPIRDAIAAAIANWDGDERFSHEGADYVLRKRLPHLCPDCHGLRDAAMVPYEPPCSHPNAPTIGKLIAIGQAVMTAQGDEDHGSMVHLDGDGPGWTNAARLLAALRAVEAQP